MKMESFHFITKIDSILSQRKQLLKYYSYPFVIFVEKYSRSLLRRVGMKK